MWKKYRTPGCSNLHRLKVNALMISSANSEAHEMRKAQVAYLIKKNKGNFISEAEKCSIEPDGSRRRVDIVNLTNGIEYEIETTPERAARFNGMKNVIVIPVGWKK